MTIGFFDGFAETVRSLLVRSHQVHYITPRSIICLTSSRELVTGPVSPELGTSGIW